MNLKMKQSKKRKKRMHAKIAPLRLEQAVTATEWFEEPNLAFAGDALHCDPKIGIPLYGPTHIPHPLGWRSTYFSSGLFRTDSKPQP
jgi:hypothetical protein